MKYRVTTPVADVHGVPDKGATRGKFESQLVMGETFIVTEEKNGWCKGTCAHDGYPGYVESARLAKQTAPAAHIITAARSHAWLEPSIKSPLAATLSFGSLVSITAADSGFVQIDGGVWVYEKHLTEAAAKDKDYIATAQKFLETPYYWGGRSGFGIDCSGLVQVSLARAGIATERDSGEQEKMIGTPTEKAQAGDIVFFKGHVGLMADDKNLLHANAFHMKTVIEPLAEVIARGNPVTSMRRP